VQELQNIAETKTGRLLRILFFRNGTVPADPEGYKFLL
jgi:hypothetical protein